MINISTYIKEASSNWPDYMNVIPLDNVRYSDSNNIYYSYDKKYCYFKKLKENPSSNSDYRPGIWAKNCETGEEVQIEDTAKELFYGCFSNGDAFFNIKTTDNKYIIYAVKNYTELIKSSSTSLIPNSFSGCKVFETSNGGRYYINYTSLYYIYEFDNTFEINFKLLYSYSYSYYLIDKFDGSIWVSGGDSSSNCFRHIILDKYTQLTALDGSTVRTLGGTNVTLYQSNNGKVYASINYTTRTGYKQGIFLLTPQYAIDVLTEEQLQIFLNEKVKWSFLYEDEYNNIYVGNKNLNFKYLFSLKDTTLSMIYDQGAGLSYFSSINKDELYITNQIKGTALALYLNLKENSITPFNYESLTSSGYIVEETPDGNRYLLSNYYIPNTQNQYILNNKTEPELILNAGYTYYQGQILTSPQGDNYIVFLAQLNYPVFVLYYLKGKEISKISESTLFNLGYYSGGNLYTFIGKDNHLYVTDSYDDTGIPTTINGLRLDGKDNCQPFSIQASKLQNLVKTDENPDDRNSVEDYFKKFFHFNVEGNLT